MREAGSGTRDVFTKGMRLHNEMIIEATLNSSEAIKNYVANSNCLGYLSGAIIKNELADKSLVALNVKDLTLMRNFYQITHKDKYQTRLCEKMLTWLNLGADPL